MTETACADLGDDNRVIFVSVGPDGQALDDGTGVEAANANDTWLVVAPPNVRLNPKFREIVLSEAFQRPEIDLFYGDEVVQGSGRGDYDIILKPAVDIALLIADDYIGFPLIVRASAMHRLGGLRFAAKTAASYDLVLRAISKGLGIARITEILVDHKQARPRPKVEDRLASLHAWLADSGNIFDLGDGIIPGTLELKRRFTSYPEVTLVVPTRQSYGGSGDGSATDRPVIIDLLDSVARSDYPMNKITVLVGDDIANDRIYSSKGWPFSFRRIVTARRSGQRFNYAAKMNELWRAAETEHLVLMNDDLVVQSTDWLQALLTFSMQDDVGGVGGRLLYPNGAIQHAGIPGGLFDLCAHAWLGQPASAPTYQNWALVHREWSIVTGALFGTRKSVLELANGFDERFSLEFNDVDLCLRLRMLGYRIVYTPYAEFVHFEKASRGEVLPPGSELAMFYKRWNEFLDDDPAYHPQLARDTFQIKPSYRGREWWMG